MVGWRTFRGRRLHCTLFLLLTFRAMLLLKRLLLAPQKLNIQIMLAALGKKLINANITITIYRTYFKVVQRNFFFLENRGIYYLKKYLNLAKTGKKIVESCLI